MSYDWHGFAAADTEIELILNGSTESELGTPPDADETTTDTLVLGAPLDSTRCAITGTPEELAYFAERLARTTTPTLRYVTTLPPRQDDQPNMAFLNFFRDGVMAAHLAPWLPCEAVEALARLLRAYEWHHPATRWVLLHQGRHYGSPRKTACVDPAHHEELDRLPGIDVQVDDSVDASVEEFLRIWTSGTLAEQVAPDMGSAEINHVIAVLEAHQRDASGWRALGGNPVNTRAVEGPHPAYVRDDRGIKYPGQIKPENLIWETWNGETIGFYSGEDIGAYRPNEVGFVVRQGPWAPNDYGNRWRDDDIMSERQAADKVLTDFNLYLSAQSEAL